MFDAVRFQSFKCLSDLELDLGQLTLLVGANASGKSTVLDGIDMLCRLAKPSDTLGRPDGIFTGASAPERVRTIGASGAFVLQGMRDGGAVLAIEYHPADATKQRPGFEL